MSAPARVSVARSRPRAERNENDFYATPPAATVALCLSGALDKFPRKIWEPACGDGAMASVLLQFDRDVVSTDLVDRCCPDGLGDVDFLKVARPLAPAIVTNPPFLLAEKFIRHAWALHVDYLAVLLTAQFFHAGKRAALFEERPPAQELKLTWRLDWTGGGAAMMDCTWYVWRPGDHAARVSLLRRPA